MILNACYGSRRKPKQGLNRFDLLKEKRKKDDRILTRIRKWKEKRKTQKKENAKRKKQ